MGDIEDAERLVKRRPAEGKGLSLKRSRKTLVPASNAGQMLLAAALTVAGVVAVIAVFGR